MSRVEEGLWPSLCKEAGSSCSQCAVFGRPGLHPQSSCLTAALGLTFLVQPVCCGSLDAPTQLSCQQREHQLWRGMRCCVCACTCVRACVHACVYVCVYWVGGVGRLEGDICCIAANVEKTVPLHNIKKQQAGNKQKPPYSSRANSDTSLPWKRPLYPEKRW